MTAAVVKRSSRPPAVGLDNNLHTQYAGQTVIVEMITGSKYIGCVSKVENGILYLQSLYGPTTDDLATQHIVAISVR